MTLMRRFVSLACALLLAFGLNLLTPARAAAEEPDPVRPGSQYLASCLQSARTLSVLIVFDKSGSLSGTDRGGVRYDGMRTLLGQLSRITRADGQPISVEVAVSAFSTGYTPARDVVGWTRVNEDPDKRAKLIDGIVTRARRGTSPSSGGSTNFQAALEGGLDDLRDRNAPDTCRVLVWFTDGEFNDAPAGVDAARASMCAPGGLLDAIRRLRIVIIGLQLGTVETDLKPMSLGRSGASTCGTHPPAEGDPPGIYLNAQDVGQLGRVFGQLTNIIQGCTDAGTSGLVDPGIRRMVVSSLVASPVNTLRLQPPDGPAFDAPASGGAQHAGGYVTQGSSDDSQVSVEVTFPPGKGAGQWGSGTTQALEMNYCVFADVALRADPNQSVPARPGATMTFQVVDRSGTPVPVSDYAQATAAASVVGPDGQPRVAKASVSGAGSVTLTFDALPSDARIDYALTLHLKTVSGLELPAVTVSAGQGLMLSEDYPLVTPRDRLDLGDAIKRNPAKADLTLLGSAKGPTRVCFAAPVDVQVPQAAHGTSLDYPAECVDLGPGETRTVTVSVTPLAIAVGDGTARIPVTLHPVAQSQSPPSSFELPVVWRFEDPFNPWVMLVTTLLVTAISALLPLLALGLATWITARYEVKGLKHKVIPVTVTGSDIRPRDAAPDAGPDDLYSVLDLDSVAGLGGATTRRFRVDPLTFASRVRPTPASVPAFWAEPPNGYAVVSSTKAPDDPDDGSRVSVPPALGLVVALVCAVDDLRSDNPEIPGRLLLLVRDSSVTGRDIAERVAALDVALVRRALQATPVAAGGSDAVAPDLFSPPRTDRLPPSDSLFKD